MPRSGPIQTTCIQCNRYVVCMRETDLGWICLHCYEAIAGCGAKVINDPADPPEQDHHMKADDRRIDSIEDYASAQEPEYGYMPIVRALCEIARQLARIADMCSFGLEKTNAEEEEQTTETAEP